MTDIDNLSDSELAAKIRDTMMYSLSETAQNVSQEVETINSDPLSKEELDSLVSENTKGATQEDVAEVSQSLFNLLSAMETNDEVVINEAVKELI